MKVKIYVEGGGDTNALKTKCRQGFSEFFRKAGLEGRMPRIVASGSRQAAYEDFCIALKKAGDDDFIALLVDSEAPVAANHEEAPWLHLKDQDNWARPAQATDENAHLMVQCMEAWFIADRPTLVAFFGQGFNENALPVNPNVEEIPKQDLYAALDAASRNSQKGRYGKGRHSFGILSQIDPTRVTDASPWARRLIDTLQDKAGGAT